MTAAGGQEQGGDKNSYTVIWLLVLIGFVGIVIWQLFSEHLKQFFIVLRTYELKLIWLFLTLLPGDLPWIGNTIQKLIEEIEANLNIVTELTPDTINLEIANAVSVTVGEYLRYPIAIYLIVLAIIIFKMSVQMRLRKKYDMRSLSAQEKVNWPQIKIATKVNILDQDLDEGPWAMAMSPLQFAKKNKLITVELADNKETAFSKNQAPEYKVTLDMARAQRAFSIQLGRPWNGFEAMMPHRQAILTVLAARGCRDSKAALELISQLANSGADGNLDCTGVEEIWKKNSKNTRVREICSQHAYEFTIFISMLQFAREDGVVASADFLWVKPIDRRLWYVLNSVGRQTPCVEVGGIFSHWYYEKALKRPLNTQKVDNAVDALKLALSEIIYIPDEKEKQEILDRHKAQEQMGQSIS